MNRAILSAAHEKGKQAKCANRLPMRLVLAFVLLTLGLLVACAPPAAPPPTPPAAKITPPQPTATAAPKPAAKVDTVRYGGVTKVADYWPVFVADAKGFFKQENIALEWTLIPTTDRLTAALIGGSLDIAGTNAGAGILAVEKGADIIFVAGGSRMALYALMGAPSVRSYADLKGKAARVAVSYVKSGDAWLAKRMLEQGGLKDKVDFDLVGVGSSSERAAALKNGAVAGAILVPPLDLQLMAEGFNRLGLSSDGVKDYQWIVQATMKNWAKNNEDLLVRFLRALKKASAWVYDSKNKGEAIQILMAEAKYDERSTTAVYEMYVEKAKSISEDMGFSTAGMRTTIEAMGDQGDLEKPLPPPEKFMDVRYLEKAK